MQPQKQRFLIGELAKAVGVKSDTVRFYERSGLLPRPARTEAGYRTYDQISPLTFDWGPRRKVRA